eukprot:jgi/Tetstr1/462650/TSEL_007634.t1
MSANSRSHGRYTRQASRCLIAHAVAYSRHKRCTRAFVFRARLLASAQYGRAYGLARGRCRVISFRRARQRTMDRCRLQETALAARPVTRTLRLHPFSPLPSHRARQAPQGHYHNQGH